MLLLSSEQSPSANAALKCKSHLQTQAHNKDFCTLIKDTSTSIPRADAQGVHFSSKPVLDPL